MSIRSSSTRKAPDEKHRPALRLGSARRGGADPMAEPFGARGLLKQYADGVEAASAISARGGSAWCEDGGQSTTRLGGDQSRRAAAPQPSPECSHVSGRPWARWVADSVKRC